MKAGYIFHTLLLNVKWFTVFTALKITKNVNKAKSLSLYS